MSAALERADTEPRGDRDQGPASLRPRVSAVIPCLNEERTIGLCIRKAQDSFARMKIVGEVIVADNGSTDRSISIASDLGARVVTEPRKGYGAALQRGISESSGEIIVMGDADDSYDWSSIEPFVRKINEGNDLVMGNRFAGGIMPGAMPLLHRYLGNPVLSAVARAAFNVQVGDFHCGMRAFTRRAFDQMQTQASGMEFATEMVAGAAHQGLRIAEVPIVLHKDQRGRPPHLRSFRDGWRHLRFILTYAPDYVYLGPGMALATLGLLLQALLIGGPITLFDQYIGLHFLALGCLMALVGFNFLNLGVLAKTIISQRYRGFRSRTAKLVESHFTLEVGLVVGALLLLTGVGVDAWLLFRWLGERGATMNSTVHLSFVASTVAVLGINVLVSSFLVNLISAGNTFNPR
jgi:hypothetical protein